MTDKNKYYDNGNTRVNPNSQRPEKKKKKKKKRRISTSFIWVILFIATVCFFIAFWNMTMFPRKWSIIAAAFLIIILILTGVLTSITSKRNRLTKLINGLLALFLFIASVLMPYYKDKVSDLINNATGNTITINLYVMTNTYKSEHQDIFADSIDVPEDLSKVNLQDYADATFNTTSTIDPDNQSYAITQLRKEVGGSITIQDSASVEDALSNLYNNTCDIMVMAQSYAATATDMAEYENFATDTEILYSFTKTISSSTSQADTELTTKPFSIFIAGNDQTGDLSLEGRTDVDMMVTVNPITAQIAIINLPRDSYVPNPAYNGTSDKLTHLGLKGIDNTLTGVSSLMGVDITSYIIVNFDTFMEIIEAMGNSITFENPYEFTAIDDQHFNAGEITIDAAGALMYVRERENLPDGDFGRNMHQQLVMKAIIAKLCSSEVITHFDSLLNAIDGKFLTNLSSESIYALCQKQLDEGISWHIVNYHIEGTTGMEYCASVSGQQLSVVYPYTNQINFASSVMQDVINGKALEQEDLPEGSFE